MQKILVVRNDKLGDFMLAYPSFAQLKTNLPNAHIAALVPRYTREMAECCPWIDEVLVDPISNNPKGGVMALTDLLERERFDAVVALFSTTRVGLAAWLAGIPYRVAPATKIAQVLFNHCLKQHRSESTKPEYQYNCDLVDHFLAQSTNPISPYTQRPFLAFEAAAVQQAHRDFCAYHQLLIDNPLVFIHAGSGGSARNLSLAQYAELARNLRPSQACTLVLSAGPSEMIGANELAQRLKGGPHRVVVYPSQQGLRAFARHIQFASVFIGGSTGPLHIAGALDVPTAGFYPRSRVNSALRWQTLNSPERRLNFAPPENAEEDDMSAVDLDRAAEAISREFLSGDQANLSG